MFSILYKEVSAMVRNALCRMMMEMCMRMSSVSSCVNG